MVQAESNWVEKKIAITGCFVESFWKNQSISITLFRFQSIDIKELCFISHLQYSWNSRRLKCSIFRVFHIPSSPYFLTTLVRDTVHKDVSMPHCHSVDTRRSLIRESGSEWENAKDQRNETRLSRVWINFHGRRSGKKKSFEIARTSPPYRRCIRYSMNSWTSISATTYNTRNFYFWGWSNYLLDHGRHETIMWFRFSSLDNSEAVPQPWEPLRRCEDLRGDKLFIPYEGLINSFLKWLKVP